MVKDLVVVKVFSKYWIAVFMAFTYLEYVVESLVFERRHSRVIARDDFKCATCSHRPVPPAVDKCRFLL